MGNILHNNDDLFQFKINKDEYWDFCLSNDNGYTADSSGLTTNCLISYIDTTNSDCIWFDTLLSIEDYYWEDAVSIGITLSYIGYTGMDNGYIHYEKDKISNQIFYDLLKNSTLNIDEGDYKLKLYKINGNNQLYDYPCEIVEEDNMIVTKMNGGFYQGFFETNCDEYKILPDSIDDGWYFEITLKKSDLETESGNTLNDKYPDNKGIFLYIGIRAENKWWALYNVDTDFEKNNYAYSVDGYFDDEYLKEADVNEGYLKDIDDKIEKEIKAFNMKLPLEYFNDDYWNSDCGANTNIQGYEFSDDSECVKNTANISSCGKIILPHPYFLNTYQDNAIWYCKNGTPLVNNEKETSRKIGSNSFDMSYDCCNDYFKDNYVSDEYFNSDYCGNDCKRYVKNEYINDELHIDKDEMFYTSDGYAFDRLDIVEYETDNKFLFFDRTPDGYNVFNWNGEENEKVIITDIKVPDDMENYFLLFNRTPNGYNTNTIKELIDEKNKEYNVLKDLFKNALAFQITDEGAIGYKYMVQDCDSEEWDYKIESEFSNEDVITEDEWHTIGIRILPTGSTCASNDETMQISIYVDGKLRLISQDLPMLKLRQMNDLYDKQQGVPFNLSLGGGTQGLCDVVYLDYLKLPEYVLPLEKEFAGSFIGFIKSFKMYNCSLSYNNIKNNYEYETKLLK